MRLAPDLWLAAGDDVSVVLAEGRYVRVPTPMITHLNRLGANPSGMTRIEASRIGFTDHDLRALLAAGLIVASPRSRQPPRLLDVVTLWRRLVISRGAVRIRGWDAVQPHLIAGHGTVPISRPPRFDELEAVARVSRGLPATAARCTEMSLALCKQLRAEGYAARISLRVFPGHTGMHAQAEVGDHVIDPNDWRTEAPAMTRMS